MVETILPVVWLVVMGAAGLWLLVTGWRGDRVEPGHPMCRRCGHDLFGLAEPFARCPECGEDLTRRGAVAAGRRRYRRRILAGVLVVGILALPATFPVYLSLTPYKPLWLLKADVDFFRGTSEGRLAINEIRRRLTAGVLTPVQLDGLKRDVLEDQARPGEPNYYWGDAFDDLYAAGHVTPQELADYVRQGLPLELSAAPQVRLGEPLRLGVKTRYELGGASNLFQMGSVVIDPVRISGRVCRNPRLAFPTSAGSSPDAAGAVPATAWALAVAGPGRHTLEADVTCIVIVRKPGGGSWYVVQWQETLSATVELVASDHAPPRLVRDEAIAEMVRGSVRIEHVVVPPHDAQGALTGPVRVSLRVEPLRVGLAHAVFIRAGADEWELGRLNLPPGEGRGFEFSLGFPELYYIAAAGVRHPFPPGTDRVDIILRPAPLGLPETQGIDRVLDHEIVIEQVPVE